MEIKQLRYFVKIADLRSISKASKALYIAQPSLSQQVANLEYELGHPLLTRLPTGVLLTEHGRILYEHAQRVLRQVEDIPTALRTCSGGLVGTVVLGLPQSSAAGYALPLIEEAQRRFPEVTLEIFDEVAGYIPGEIDCGRFDFGIVTNDEDAGMLESAPLVDEELFLVSRPDMAPLTPTITATQLSKLRLFLPSVGQGSRALVDAFLKQQDTELPRLPVLVNSVNTMRRAMLAGIAHSIMPWSALSEEARSNVFTLTPMEPSLVRRIYISRPRNSALSKAAQAIYQLLIETARGEVTSGRWRGVELV
ncbi:LysR substrate-binding domain-containing protein [Variovorax ureilyticus]|uniref:LysR substrate-binding domain-containing protein n=1 Tax=Variovorax ureilyticus TaxID=1836198 RepID=A0ABU8VKW4_9BURK